MGSGKNGIQKNRYPHRGEAFLGKFVLYKVDIACQNKAVDLAEDIFVDYVEWRKSTTTPFHEFLVFYVNERQQLGKTPHVSVILIDRCVAEKDSNGPEQKKNDSESTIHGKPLRLNFFEGGKRTSSPYCPPIPKATGTPALLRLSQSVHNLSSPSNQLPAEITCASPWTGVWESLSAPNVCLLFWNP